MRIGYLGSAFARSLSQSNFFWSSFALISLLDEEDDSCTVIGSLHARETCFHGLRYVVAKAPWLD